VKPWLPYLYIDALMYLLAAALITPLLWGLVERVLDALGD
jgi:hypothetical protein